MVAVNRFDGELSHGLEDVRWALAIGENTPLVTFDARDRLSVRDALLAVLAQGLREARLAGKSAKSHVTLRDAHDGA